MTIRQIDDRYISTAYSANSPARPVLAVPGQFGSVRTQYPVTPSTTRPGKHNSFRASYISLDESLYSRPPTQTHPPSVAQALRSPAQIGLPSLDSRTLAPTAPAMYQNGFHQPPQQPTAAFLHHNGFAQSQSPQQPAPAIIYTHQLGLDHPYSNSPFSSPKPKEPERYKGLSWHMNNDAPFNDPKDKSEYMSTMSSSRSLRSAGSNAPFAKGVSGFEKSVENLTLMQRARKARLITFLLGLIAVIFAVEECVVGVAWAMVLSKHPNGASSFAVGYFGSKAKNFTGSAIAALVGLTVQWFLFSKLAQSRVALQLWSFILIFLTYMGCCIAAGVHRKLDLTA